MAVCLHVCACCSESRKQKQKVYLIDGLMFIVPWISGDLYWGDIVIASSLFIYKVILIIIIISPFSLPTQLFQRIPHLNIGGFIQATYILEIRQLLVLH